MKCTSPRFGQINSRGHIEHSVTPFLVSFITNSMNWIFWNPPPLALFCLFIISFVTYSISCCSLYAPYSLPTMYLPLYFYMANEIPLHQIPTRRVWKLGKYVSHYSRSAILASNPPIFSTPLFFFTINSMNWWAHVNSAIKMTHTNGTYSPL